VTTLRTVAQDTTESALHPKGHNPKLANARGELHQIHMRHVETDASTKES
jgi:hypothetical protein